MEFLLFTPSEPPMAASDGSRTPGEGCSKWPTGSVVVAAGRWLHGAECRKTRGRSVFDNVCVDRSVLYFYLRLALDKFIFVCCVIKSSFIHNGE
jgi:hypothetical protein